MSVTNQPSIEDQKKFWEWHWQHWQDRKTVNGWKDRRHDRVLHYVSSLGLQRPRMLDVGCGPGWYTNKLSKFGSVMGIDLSEEAVAMANTRFPHVNFVAGNIYTHPLPVAHFDLVVSQEVIDHVEDIPKFVDRIADIMKPKGYFVLSCTNKYIMDRLDERESPPNPTNHIGRYMDKKTLKQVLSRRFNFLKSETILPMGHRGLLRVTNSPKLNDMLAAFMSRQKIEELKEKAGLGYQIIALAQKK